MVSHAHHRAALRVPGLLLTECEQVTSSDKTTRSAGAYERLCQTPCPCCSRVLARAASLLSLPALAGRQGTLCTPVRAGCLEQNHRLIGKLSMCLNGSVSFSHCQKCSAGCLDRSLPVLCFVWDVLDTQCLFCLFCLVCLFLFVCFPVRNSVGNSPALLSGRQS